MNWIEETIRAGARDHFDFIAVHPYETLGVVESDGCEAEFMSIVPTLRKMLEEQNPGRASVPIWFTEIGRDAGKDEHLQASALVKAFTMGIAQGVERINWFEGKDGDSGPMGLLARRWHAAPGLHSDVELDDVSGALPQIHGVGAA